MERTTKTAVPGRGQRLILKEEGRGKIRLGSSLSMEDQLRARTNLRNGEGDSWHGSKIALLGIGVEGLEPEELEGEV